MELLCGEGGGKVHVLVILSPKFKPGLGGQNYNNSTSYPLTWTGGMRGADGGAEGGVVQLRPVVYVMGPVMGEDTTEDLLARP